MTEYCPFRKGTLLVLSGPVNHLHIIMNDPVFFPEVGYNGVLLVNISSARPNKRFDPACLIEAGEHRFITHRSYVVYSDAVVKNADSVAQFVATGEFATHDPVEEHIHQRVLAGFDQSRRVKPKILRFIKNYIL